MNAKLWTLVVDGEYNEQTCEVQGRQVSLFSDRDGEKWAYTIDDGDIVYAEARNEVEAKLEAIIAVGNING
jgi:hypothetical protein